MKIKVYILSGNMNIISETGSGYFEGADVKLSVHGKLDMRDLPSVSLVDNH